MGVIQLWHTWLGNYSDPQLGAGEHWLPCLLTIQTNFLPPTSHWTSPENGVSCPYKTSLILPCKQHPCYRKWLQRRGKKHICGRERGPSAWCMVCQQVTLLLVGTVVYHPYHTYTYNYTILEPSHKRSVLALLASSFHLEPTLHPVSLYIFVPTYIIKLKPAGSIELQCTPYVFPWWTFWREESWHVCVPLNYEKDQTTVPFMSKYS